MDPDTRPHPAAKDDDDLLSPLEQEVLDAYARLAGNLDNVLPSPPSRDPVGISKADECLVVDYSRGTGQ